MDNPVGNLGLERAAIPADHMDVSHLPLRGADLLRAVAQTVDPVTIETKASGTATLTAFALAVLAIMTFTIWYHQRSHHRLVRDLPTSRTGGVGIGLHEVTGRIVGGQAMPCPYSGIQAVWWELETQVEDKSDNGRTQWKTVSRQLGGPACFDVDDGSGPVSVWPRRAGVTGVLMYEGPERLRAERPTDDTIVVRRPRDDWDLLALRTDVPARRVIERALPHGETVYVIGTARPDPTAIRPAIGADPTGEAPFLIDMRGEASVVRRYGATARVASVVCVLAAAVSGGLFDNSEAIGAGTATLDEVSKLGAVIGAAAALAAMGLVSVAFVYNRLVLVRNRARVAWSLIDVELNRRRDLIPALESVTRGHSQHERSLLETLSVLRTLTINLPTLPSDTAVRRSDASVAHAGALVGRVEALSEAYPQLTADETFRGLQSQLVETENRIAMARTFYNDSVETLRDRGQVFPASVLARLFGLSLSAEFIGAADPAAASVVTPPSSSRVGV